MHDLVDEFRKTSGKESDRPVLELSVCLYGPKRNLIAFPLKNNSGQNLTNAVLLFESELAAKSLKTRQRHLVFVDNWADGETIELPPGLVDKTLSSKRTAQKKVVTFTLLTDQLSKSKADLDLFVARPRGVPNAPVTIYDFTPSN